MLKSRNLEDWKKSPSFFEAALYIRPHSLIGRSKKLKNFIEAAAYQRSFTVFYRKGSDRMKFFCYSLFGWGMPLGMAVLTGLFDHFSIGNVRPQMGESFCFLSIRGARFFFYMPILILLCFN